MAKNKFKLIALALVFVLAFGGTLYIRGTRVIPVRKPILGDIPKVQVYDVQYKDGVWVDSKVIKQGLKIFSGLENRDVLFASEEFREYINSHLDASQYSDYKDLEKLKEIKTDVIELTKYFDWRDMVRATIDLSDKGVKEYKYEFQNTPEDGFVYRMYGILVLSDGKEESFDYTYKAEYMTMVEDMRANSDAKPISGVTAKETVYM